MLRGQRDSEAILEGCEEAMVEGVLETSETVISIYLRHGVRKRATLNGNGLKRSADVMGRIPTVTFTIEDLLIVRGEPKDRRHFLDSCLCQMFPSYLQHLAGYKRALEQRNSLLKTAQESHVEPEHFEVWESELALHGSKLRGYRRDFIDQIELHAQTLHQEMAKSELLTVTYCPRDAIEHDSELLGELARQRSYEIMRGTSQVGPHRDDIGVRIDGREARIYGSQGQQRTATLAIKLAALKVFESSLGFAPLLLLDDIFAELDASRRSKLTEVADKHVGQVILTCTEADQAGSALLGRATCFSVKSGQIESYHAQSF